MEKYILKYTVKLWYEMTFNNNKYSEQLFNLIEGYYKVIESYMCLINYIR